MTGKLFLIPNTLGDTKTDIVLPSYVSEVINTLDHFIVENIRNARRFIIKCGYSGSIDDIVFFELNKHTQAKDIPSFIEPCKIGTNIGLISEAGVPAVADPGNEICKLAHDQNIRVVPLSGPSSIILSLMASGLNGQNFAFHGYLPIDKSQRIKRIKSLDAEIRKTGQTQIFIETPYRNDQLLKDLVKSCSPDTKLCLACDLTMKNEYISTKPIAEWKKNKATFHKRPCIFLIGF